ncbi:acyl transferase/acyl hydrolase/lysophospholipase [Roridomyces roridus]|uniref:Lysophospholipase n=1 Tax=Roridomyces roridus TaxID=1738132 RepID=A0AAD7BB55_9AGAR|nr:acyl transferase/acyl hydrolase/lysophospholipase [Roridomyces roridus]
MHQRPLLLTTMSSRTDSQETAFRGLEKEQAGKTGYFGAGADAGKHDEEGKEHHTGLSGLFSKLSTTLSSAGTAIKFISHTYEEDPSLSPHKDEQAHLRRTNALSPEELTFLVARVDKIVRDRTLHAFLGLDEDVEVDPLDVPVIGLGGSGGGMRANLGFITTMIAFQELGLWPAVMYTAGVSGACWGLAAQYTLPLDPPLTAPLSARPLLDHFRRITGTHPLSTDGVNKVAAAQGGVEALLGPLKEKEKNGQEVCIIDLYSTLTSSYFWLLGAGEGEGPDVNKGRVEPASLKWSRAFEHGGLDKGMEPWPMLTAVRHERPWHDWKSPTEPFTDDHTANSAEHEDVKAWWQWFELNPVEVGSDELEGWVPTWAFGRHFEKGVSTQNLAEYSLALLMGLATAAPAAPLSAILGTIWRNLPQNSMGAMMRRAVQHVTKDVGDEKMEHVDNVNPVHAGNQANPFFGAEKLPHRGNGFENAPRLHLVDSGMANNLPTHVFLHPARDVDLIFLFDASSDVQKGAAIDRINEYGATKGLVFTPRVKYPALDPVPEVESTDPKDKGKKIPKQLSADEIAARFEGRYAQILDGVATSVVAGHEGVVYNDKHQPQAWRDVMLVYLPLLPNAVNPTYDPSTAPFSSSYNLVWTPDEVDSIHKTAEANVRNGLPIIKQAVREAYERRRALRLAGTKNPVEVARANTARGDVEMDTYVEDRKPENVVEENAKPGVRPWMES